MLYLSSIVLPPGEQPCSEHYLLHWTGNFIGMPVLHHHLLHIVGVSKGRMDAVPTTLLCTTNFFVNPFFLCVL